MKRYSTLLIIALLCLLLALLIALTAADVQFGTASSVQLPGYDPVAQHRPPHEGYEAPKPLLVLYSPQNETSVIFTDNLCKTLDYLKWEYKKLDIGRTESESYNDYSMVVMATNTMEQDLKDDIRRLLRYIEGEASSSWEFSNRSVSGISGRSTMSWEFTNTPTMQTSTICILKKT